MQELQFKVHELQLQCMSLEDELLKQSMEFATATRKEASSEKLCAEQLVHELKETLNNLAKSLKKCLHMTFQNEICLHSKTYYGLGWYDALTNFSSFIIVLETYTSPLEQ